MTKPNHGFPKGMDVSWCSSPTHYRRKTSDIMLDGMSFHDDFTTGGTGHMKHMLMRQKKRTQLLCKAQLEAWQAENARRGPTLSIDASGKTADTPIPAQISRHRSEPAIVQDLGQGDRLSSGGSMPGTLSDYKFPSDQGKRPSSSFRGSDVSLQLTSDTSSRGGRARTTPGARQRAPSLGSGAQSPVSKPSSPMSLRSRASGDSGYVLEEKVTPVPGSAILKEGHASDLTLLTFPATGSLRQGRIERSSNPWITRTPHAPQRKFNLADMTFSRGCREGYAAIPA